MNVGELAIRKVLEEESMVENPNVTVTANGHIICE